MANALEWERYAVTEENRRELISISHVAHLEVASRILSDQRIRSGLVYDESCLNTSRITVVWLSPNDWTGAGGFRYGNIRFAFDWNSLLIGKEFYWVEIMPYGVPACRILVTDADRHRILPRYDPRAHTGPWIVDEETGRHYWNSTCCLEIMLERDVLIGECTGLDFVTHHPDMCCEYPIDCGTRGLRSNQAGGRFVAQIVSKQIDPRNLGLVEVANYRRSPTLDLRNAYINIHNHLWLNSPPSWGYVYGRHLVSPSLARAVLSAYARRLDDDVLRLSSVFRSRDDLINVTRRTITAHFQLADANQLLA